MKHILIISALFFTITSFAQTNVTGNIVDENLEPLPFSNILILSEKDSSLIQGEFITDGHFEIKHTISRFLLKITSFGFEEKLIPITKSIDLNDIKMKSLQLDEVSVVAEKLAFELENGVTKINVSNSIFQSTGSVNEILSKSPGVSASGTGFSVIGRGEALVYIDNKLSSTEALSAIPVSKIESIEIIKNPDASYEASGKAVILVHLKELGLEGFQGKVLSHYTKAFYQLGYLDFSLNWHKNKLSVSASGNTNIGATGSIRIDSLNAPNLEQPYQANSDFNEKVLLNHVSNFLVGAKYQLSPKHDISLEYNGNRSFYELNVNTDIQQNFENDTKTIQALNRGTSLWSTDVLSANYQWKVDSLGSRLFIGATYSAVSKDYADKINESANYNLVETISNSTSESDNLNLLKIGQIDYTKVFANTSKLKIGLKHTTSHSFTAVRLNTLSNDSLINNINNSYNYQEQINAGYINWKSKWKKGYYEIGTRLEHTTAIANKETETVNYIDTTYLGVFPNLNFTTQLKKWTLSEKFKAKISRPNFGEITPYIYYLNAFTAVLGNPEIRPSYIYNFEHQFSNKKWGTNINLGLNHEKSPKLFVIFQNDSATTDNTISVVNLKRHDQLYFEVGQGVNVKGITGYNMVNISLNRIEDDNLNFGEVGISPKFYFYSYTKFPIKKWFNFELLGSYTSQYSDGRRVLQPAGELGFGFSKSFGNNKWFVQLFCNDVFQTSKERFKLNLNGNTINGKAIEDSRFLRFTISYSFGKLKALQYDHNSINETELNRTN